MIGLIMGLKVCPRGDCVRLYCVGSDEWVERGGSLFCVGRLSGVDVQVFGEVEHRNDYAFCVYSPKKGLVGFLINANDAFIMENEMGAILRDYRAGLKKRD